MQFKNSYNSENFNNRLEPKSNKPSMTIPDQTMTIQQIMSKYVKGIPFENQKEGQYYGEEYIPDVQRMDISEKFELLNEMKENNKQKLKEYKNSQKQTT